MNGWPLRGWRGAGGGSLARTVRPARRRRGGARCAGGRGAGAGDVARSVYRRADGAFANDCPAGSLAHDARCDRSIAVACGMAWWKRPEIARFLWHPGRPLAFARRPARALAIARKAGKPRGLALAGVAAIDCGSRRSGVPLVRVEDGFVRSVGLGVDLVPPSSVVVDASGIHFDPRGASDLETLLAHGDMPASLLARAAALRAAIVAAGISKYAADTGATVPERRAGKRLVLVPGQVEDDMSVRAGAGLTSNLELVPRPRARTRGGNLVPAPSRCRCRAPQGQSSRCGDPRPCRPDRARGHGAAARCGRCGACAHLADRVRGADARARGGLPWHPVLRRVGPHARPWPGACAAGAHALPRCARGRGADLLSALSRPGDGPSLPARSADCAHGRRGARGLDQPPCLGGAAAPLAGQADETVR
jgi:hypothetical protein